MTNTPSDPPRSARLFPLAIALTLASGAAGLAHEIVWTRRLVDLLGAWLASRRAGAGADFWKRVAALALPALFCMNLAGALHPGLPGNPWLKLLVPLLLVTPPPRRWGWCCRGSCARWLRTARSPAIGRCGSTR